MPYQSSSAASDLSLPRHSAVEWRESKGTSRKRTVTGAPALAEAADAPTPAIRRALWNLARALGASACERRRTADRLITLGPADAIERACGAPVRPHRRRTDGRGRRSVGLSDKPRRCRPEVAEHYPQIKASTVRAHIVGLTANDRSRHHYPSLARREALFTRHPDGSLGAFDGLDENHADEAEDLDVTATPPLEFALEAFLEEFILTNWEGIDWGRPLELWESDVNELGHQLATPVGRLNFLCRDTASDALVVVELKRGRPSDTVVGQAARYMGWDSAHIAAENQPVEGIIVAHEQDLRLAYAVAAVPGYRSSRTPLISRFRLPSDLPTSPEPLRAAGGACGTPRRPCRAIRAQSARGLSPRPNAQRTFARSDALA